MRQLSVLSLLSLALACAGEPTEETPDAGSRFEKVIIRTAGTVRLHPLEAKWRADNTLPTPTFEGLKIAVEDALKATSGGPPLATGTVGANGVWEVADVDVTNVSLAVVATVSEPDGHESDAQKQLAPTGYGLVRGRPDGDLLDKPVFVMTRAFIDRIATGTGLTGEDLLAEGFMFAQVTDADGAPLADAELAKMSPSPRAIESSEDHPIWYLDAALTGLATGAKTSASGTAIYLPGIGAKEYSAVLSGHEFEVKLSGARPNVALSVFVPAVR